MSEAKFIAKQIRYFDNRYKNLCSRLGLDPKVNKPMMFLNHLGMFVIGVKKPFKK